MTYPWFTMSRAVTARLLGLRIIACGSKKIDSVAGETAWGSLVTTNGNIFGKNVNNNNN